MGAKIAGAVGNPAGLTYLSWTGSADSGHTCTLLREEPTGTWGLAEDPRTSDIVGIADPALCPSEIKDAGWRGTAVVFHGKGPDHNTTLSPIPELGVDWLEKAINVRFYELPTHVRVRCQRAGDDFIRRAIGQRALLAEHTAAGSSVQLSDATVHWRILTEGTHERRRKQNSRWAATGHRAALHEGELYELRQHSSGGWRKLQEFGIVFGHERVVLYVEPDRVVPDTVRAHLTPVSSDAENKELPWDRWADEFIERMPPALRKLVEKSAGDSANRDRRDIMRQLEKLAEDMPIPRYRSESNGATEGGPFTHGGGERSGEGTATTDPSKDQAGGRHGGNVVTMFTRIDGSPVERTDKGQIPEIQPVWISRETGSRPPGVLEDLAATFLTRQGIVQLNGDFRGYVALLKFFRVKYGRQIGGAPVIVAEVRAAYEDLVIEYIFGVLRLRSQPHWTSKAEGHVLDDRCLTGCLMQHYTLAGRIDERLARRLRKAA
jgi:hypothetical protein